MCKGSQQGRWEYLSVSADYPASGAWLKQAIYPPLNYMWSWLCIDYKWAVAQGVSAATTIVTQQMPAHVRQYPEYISCYFVNECWIIKKIKCIWLLQISRGTRFSKHLRECWICRTVGCSYNCIPPFFTDSGWRCWKRLILIS